MLPTEFLITEWWFVPLGFVLGTFGTLIGAGGGFILTPLLLLLYPAEPPDVITSISLAVVFFNSLSGSAAYAVMKRIDYRSAILFSLTAVPAAILGALSTSYIPRKQFDELFGILMILGSIFLLLRPKTAEGAIRSNFRAQRRIVDAEGRTYSYGYTPATGIVLSVFVGFLSSFLGVGGGFIHVPALVVLLHFPVHIATATSHCMLAVMTMTGTLVHIFTGTFSKVAVMTLLLTIGVIPGAQLGAKLSNRVDAEWILRSLAVALGFVGVRLVIGGLHR